MKRKIRFIANLLLFIFLIQLTIPMTAFAEDADKYKYEPGNFILGKNNVLSWRNPTADTLQTVKVYMLDGESETDVTASKVTAVNLSGTSVSVNTPSAVVSLAGASDSSAMTCSCRLVFTFSDGEERNILFADKYGTTALFIQSQHSATPNPNSSGSGLNVDVYRDNVSAKASLCNTIVRTGKNSLKLESNKNDNGHFSLQFGGLAANTVYNVSMWVNTIEETALSLDGTKRNIENTGGEWKELTFSFTNADTKFQLSPVGFNREIYIDDISFTEAGKTEPMLVMGFETIELRGSGITDISCYSGDKAVKLEWAEQSASVSGSDYVNVYEQITAGGRTELVLRARVPRSLSTGVTLSGLENDVEHTFVIKCQRNNYNYGLGLESDGVTVTAVPHFYSEELALVQLAEAQKAELELLLAECNEKGIFPDYEKADVELVRIYAEKVRLEYERMVYDNIEKYVGAVGEVYSETKARLNAFIDGSEFPVAVPRLDAFSNTIEDGNLAVTSKDGSEHAAVTIGFSAFRSDDTYIGQMGDLGFNAIQHDGLRKGPRHIVEYDETAQDFVKNTQTADTELAAFRKTMDLCREKGIMVDVGTSVHYVDESISSKSGASDFRSSGGSYGTFINFNPTSSTAKKMLKKYFEVYIPVIYEYKDIVTSITFVNEPYFEAWDKSYYYDEWTAFLENKYTDLNELCSAYGTEYDSFEAVKMPEYVPGRDENTTELWTTALHLDYRLFVTDIMYEFFDFCINEIDKYTNGEIPCGVKTMQFFRSYIARWKDSYTREISYDYEKIAPLFDFNGTDTFSYYNNGSISLPAKLSWYDFTTSVKDVPILDTETHIADSSSPLDAGGIMPDYASASVWMGAIHGCDLAATWLYSDTELASQHYDSSFLRNPESLRKLSYTAMDAQRLSEEITAFQRDKRETAILYSYECLMLNLQYEANKFTAYEMLINNGQRPLFVTENSLDKLADCKLLVIPGNLIVKNEATLDTILGFLEDGGKVVLIGDTCFSRDKNNMAITDSRILSKVDDIKKAATVIAADLSHDTAKSAFSAGAEAKLQEILESAGLLDIKLIDSASKEIAAVEWNAVEYNGETLISACNYSDEAVTVQAYINGAFQTGIDDLKNMSYGLSEVELEPYAPVMLKLSDIEASFSVEDDSGKEVESIAKGGYRASVSVTNNNCGDDLTAVLIAAVYKDGMLDSLYTSDSKTVSRGTSESLSLNKSISIPDTSDGEYLLKLMLWEGLNTFKPLVDAKSFTE